MKILTFEAAGIEKKLKKVKSFPIPVINQNMIDEIKKSINGSQDGRAGQPSQKFTSCSGRN